MIFLQASSWEKPAPILGEPSPGHPIPLQSYQIIANFSAAYQGGFLSCYSVAKPMPIIYNVLFLKYQRALQFSSNHVINLSEGTRGNSITVYILSVNCHIASCFGRIIVKVLPFPGALFIETLPPCALTMRLTTASPTPNPPTLRVR